MNDNFPANGGLLIVVALIDFVIAAGIYVWIAASLSAVFKKVGEPTWAAWVPFYNLAVVLKLGGFSPWLMLILIASPIPIVGWLAAVAVDVLLLIAAYRINIAFGYRDGAAVGMTFLAVLFPVWSSVLGWGSARWVGPDPRMRAAAIGQHPGASFAPAYPQPGGYPTEPAQPGFGPGYTPVAGAFAPPAAPAGYVPPAAPAGYVPPAAPAGYVPPAPAGAVPPAAADPAPALLFPPRSSAPTAASDDDDLEGIDDPIRGRRGQADVDTVSEGQPISDAAAPVPVIDAVPAPVPAPVDPVDPWAPAPAGPRRSPMPDDASAFSDTSAEVSAVAGSPLAGAPMSARSSVSAQRNEPELPDPEAAFDETIIAPRHRTEWMLTPPLGAPIRITATVLILGRRPAADPAYPDAQLIDLADDTRTVSKTHARLELVPMASSAGADASKGAAGAPGHWTITDLDSTNGVVLIAADGTETELASGGSQLVGERFLLGDAQLQLTRTQD